LVTNCCVTDRAGADFACDHLAGVQSNSQLERCSDFRLDVQRCHTCTERMVFQGGWSAEHRHDAVARELAQSSAVALHHGCGTVQQFGHDLA
jgi:hypothetical protein